MVKCFNKSGYEKVNEDSSDYFDNLLDDVSKYFNNDEETNIWKRLGIKIKFFLYSLVHREPKV